MPVDAAPQALLSMVTYDRSIRKATCQRVPHSAISYLLRPRRSFRLHTLFSLSHNAVHPFKEKRAGR